MNQVTSKTYDAINPATAEAFTQIPDASLEDATKAIDRAYDAFQNGAWRTFSYLERGIYLKKIAKLIREHARELADLEIADVGKTSKHANFIDIPTAADCFDYFSNVSLTDEDLKVDAPVKSQLIYEPRGVVTAICSYNYPMLYAAWKIAPAIMAGNCVIIKPSPHASATIVRFCKLLSAVGLPENVVQVVTTTDQEALAKLVRCSKVAMVSFTGSTRTGKKVMAEASKKAKKVILELGGKSPNIVFNDCQMEAALGGTLTAAFMNQGQMCTAGSRLFLQEDIYDDFMKRLVDRAKTLKIGDPKSATTEFGPLTSKEQRDYLLKVVEQARADGASVACGGGIPQGHEQGFFIEPTILTGVTNDMNVAQEECFGPVLCVIKFKSEEDLIKMVNDSKYGLAAMIWTQDEEKQKSVSRQLECGTVWVNTYGSFLNEAPFGGYKQSGFGRELGDEGLKEYLQVKHICTDQTPGGVPLAASWF